ncbi:MAG: AzlC family ABC transporter permease [Brevefilum sp.]|nr:AzlC family ABC transporter permease [Brevefilum sp.]
MTENRRLKVKDNTRPWLRGVIAALPIMLGYLPVGFAYGVLAQKAGLSTLNTMLMSMIVFAGSAQLIAVGLVANGIGPLTIILTAFVVNLRHLLFSAAIFPHLTHWRKRELAVFASELTDETFALHSTRFEREQVEKSEAFAINIVSHITWVLGGWLGVVAGQLVVEIEPLALDYVLPAMFIGLLVMQIKSRTQVWVALLAGTASVAFLLLGFNQWHVIIATMIGATFGAWIDGWTRI